MPRFYLFGKNKISIFNPFSGWMCLWHLLLLALICYLGVQKLCGQQELAKERRELALTQRVRIFCVIVTYGIRHVHGAVHVRNTWAKDCNQYVFVSDDADELLEPAVFMHSNDKWQRMRAYWEYVFNYHFDEGDWFLYANDDNFVVVDNLLYLLQHYSSHESIYFGCKLKTPQNQTYMYDGSALVLSSAALRAFVLQALPNGSLCSQDDHHNDANEQLGRCLTNVNVTAGDSRDKWLKHTFLPFEDAQHLFPTPLNATLEKHKHFLERSYYEVQNLFLPVSKYAICFRVDYPPMMHDLNYFIHKVNIFGLERRIEELEAFQLEEAVNEAEL